MSFRALLSLTLAGLLLAPSASALSCMAPDLVSDLNKAKASEKTYYVLVGTFNAPQIKREQFDPRKNQGFSGDRSQSVRGRFTGVSIGADPRADGRLNNFPVTITTGCAASWCGQVPPSDYEFIAFVEAKDGARPVLTVGPCPSMLYRASPERVRKLRQCLDKDCEPSRPQY